MSLVLLATSRTIWAPMFSNGFSSSISLATVTPSLVIVGEPNFLSSTTLRPRGPSVLLTARLSFSMPVSIELAGFRIIFNLFCCHSSSVCSCVISPAR